MTGIDSMVLDGMERFCRKFQRLTGRTNVWLAVQVTNLSIVVYFVWAGVYIWRSDVELRIGLALLCAGLLYVLTQTVFKVPIEVSENNAYRRVSKGVRNPRRLRDAPLRLSFLTLAVVLLFPVIPAYLYFRAHIIFLGYPLILLTTVVLYLLACDPLPPCAGKLREWIRGAAPARLAPESRAGRGEYSRPGATHEMSEPAMSGEAEASSVRNSP